MRALAPDAGCRVTRDALDRYVEAELAGREPDAAIALHLRRCPACRADHEGLLAAAAGHVDSGA
jgi:predicted anti-sigma-YlaC factor YlaD